MQGNQKLNKVAKFTSKYSWFKYECTFINHTKTKCNYEFIWKSTG